ncbi:MAG: winged helix-turn-helix transcriptional regulator [Planctomycetaceae bacterium]|nr:winged helix-turn-helix transcriptional regulator [Planctomycetaceae bacterium]
MSGNDSPSGQFWRADQPSHPLGIDRPQEISSDSGPSQGDYTIPAGELIDQIQRTALLLKTRLADHFQSFGLNEIRYTVMKMVHDSAPHGCSQTDLADALNQSESSISTLVERMRTDNLIYRLRSKLDRRKRVLILTESGQSILSQIETCHAQRLEEMMRNFGPEQRRQLSEMLNQLMQHIEAKSPGIPTDAGHELKAPHLSQNRSGINNPSSKPR